MESLNDSERPFPRAVVATKQPAFPWGEYFLLLVAAGILVEAVFTNLNPNAHHCVNEQHTQSLCIQTGRDNRILQGFVKIK